MSRELLTLLLLLGPAALAESPDAGRSPAEVARSLGIQPFRWDVPKVLSEVQVPGTFEANGIPTRFHKVVSGMSLEALYQHFHAAFLRAHLYVAPPEHQLGLGGGQVMLTGFDTLTETSYSVILEQYPNGTTMVILGEAHFAGRTLRSSLPAWAPLFPGASGLASTNLESAQTLAYEVRASAAEVRAFYAEVLGKDGYAAQPDGSFVRGAELLSVVTQPSKKDRAATTVLVTRTLAPTP